MNEISEINKDIFSNNRINLPLFRWNKMLSLLNFPIKNVLDIGAWDKDFLLMLPENIEKHAVDIADRDFGKNISFKKTDISKELPYPNGFFDAIFIGEVIEHLFDPSLFLTEVKRILSKNGQVIISTPNLSYWKNILQIIKGDNLYWVDYKNNQNGHIRYFSYNALKNVLLQAGFVNNKIISVDDYKGSFFINLISMFVQILCKKHNMTLIAHSTNN